MPASQVFSGTGDPNGVVDGNPGDLYQDQAGGAWVNTAAPSTWAQLSAGAGGGDGAVDLIVEGGLTRSVAGPYRPASDVWSFDDYLSNPANTFTLKSAAAVISYNSLNITGGPGGNYLGTAEGIIFGSTDDFTSFSHFHNEDPGAPSNQFIRLSSLPDGSDLWVVAKVGFEGSGNPNGFSDGNGAGTFNALVGFHEHVEFDFWNDTDSGIYLYPNRTGDPGEIWATWFLRAKNAIDNVAIDCGVEVFNGANGRAGREMIVHLVRHAPSAGNDLTVEAYLDGALAASVEVASANFSPMGSVAALRVNNGVNVGDNIYMDYFGLAMRGRP